MDDQHRHTTTTTIVVNAPDQEVSAFQASLVGLSGSVFGQRFLLGRDRVILGRDPETCDVLVSDSGVSRRHAEIVRTGRGHRLVDCGSKNGTTVDGVRVAEVELRDGQQIGVGKSVLKYLRLNVLELQYHDRMARLTNTDELTGLFNRRHAWDTLDQELARSVRHGHDLSVVIFDIDHFKRINDTLGHPIGDECLVEVARRVGAAVRREDVLARIGGEEFLVICPETDILEAAELATRIRDAVGSEGVETSRKNVGVTVSLGVADLRELQVAGGADVTADRTAAVEALVALADAKLYEAKHMGRNRVAV